MGCVSIPNDKLQRLHAVISTALKGKYTDRATLSKLCGMLQWLFKLSPLAKPWLRALYLDLNTPRATNFSVRQNEWQAFVSCLSETLHLIQLPAGAAVTVGSKVLAVRHRKVKTKQDLLHCNLGDKDIWLRIADPASKRRSLSPASKALLHFWLGWSQLPPLWRALRPQQHVAVEAAADAMGNGEIFAIGGYISLASEFWFSEKFTVADLHLLLYLSNLRPIAISAAMSALVRLHWFGCLAYCIHAVAFQFVCIRGVTTLVQNLPRTKCLQLPGHLQLSLSALHCLPALLVYIWMSSILLGPRTRTQITLADGWSILHWPLDGSVLFAGDFHFASSGTQDLRFPFHLLLGSQIFRCLLVLH